MKIFLSIVLVVHGLIHLMGFVKAFDLADLKDMKGSIPKSLGILWLTCSFLFFSATIALLTGHYWWLILGIIGIVLSQILIVSSWQDSKFGTLVNVLLVILITIEFGRWSMEQDFEKDVVLGMATVEDEAVLTNEDIAHLPPKIQQYLSYVGVIGKPKVQNLMMTFDGKMRRKGEPWFDFNSAQYNFFHDYRRLFYIEANINHIPTIGYHYYGNDTARMVMKVLSHYPVIDLSGDLLFRAETVTMFNDMCFFAPASLIDNRIRWNVIDENKVRTFFRNDAVEISAVLHFNDKNQLINFVSDDRYALAGDQLLSYTFSTPVMEYGNFNGFNLAKSAEAIWHYPGGKFVYGKFTLQGLKYNVKN